MYVYIIIYIYNIYIIIYIYIIISRGHGHGFFSRSFGPKTGAIFWPPKRGRHFSRKLPLCPILGLIFGTMKLRKCNSII